MGGPYNRRLTAEEIVQRKSQEAQIEAQDKYNGTDLDSVFKRVKSRVIVLGVIGTAAFTGYEVRQGLTEEQPAPPSFVTLEDEQAENNLRCLRETFRDACQNPLFESPWKKDNCQHLPDFDELEDIVGAREKIFNENNIPSGTEQWFCNNMRDGGIAQFEGSLITPTPKGQTPPVKFQSHLAEQQPSQTLNSD